VFFEFRVDVSIIITFDRDSFPRRNRGKD